MDAYRQTDEYKEYKERRREIKLATDQEKMPEAKKKVIKERQAALRLSLAQGHAPNFETYQRLVGEYQGLQWMLDAIDAKLAEQDE